MEQISDIDQRLSQIICQAFDNCNGCESIFKLFEMLGSLVERPLIQRDFRYKYPVLLELVSQDLDSAKQIFDQQMELMKSPEGPVINKNMPHVAGLLRWSQELRERVDQYMVKLKIINHGWDTILVYAHHWILSASYCLTYVVVDGGVRT